MGQERQCDYTFSFERLDVFRVAVEFLRWVHGVLLPRLGHGFSRERDQVRRAALSVVLNIAEGAEQESAAMKRKHYRIARGSAGECAAFIIAFTCLGFGGLDRGDSLVRRLGAMLSKMAR